MKKQLLSIILSLCFICLFPISGYAEEIGNQIISKDSEITATIQELEDGLTLYLVTNSDGSYSLSKSETRAVQQVFTLQLKGAGNTRYLFWKATIPSGWGFLMNVRGNFYVKNTNILYPEFYYYQPIQ